MNSFFNMLFSLVSPEFLGLGTVFAERERERERETKRQNVIFQGIGVSKCNLLASYCLHSAMLFLYGRDAACHVSTNYLSSKIVMPME